MGRKNVVDAVVSKLLEAVLVKKGENKMDGKTLGGIVIAGVLIVLGFLAYRLILIETIVRLAN